MASNRKNVESTENTEHEEALGGGRGRAHERKCLKGRTMEVDEVLLSLRTTYSGRSSLREAWLAWSARQSVLTFEALALQLDRLGLQVHESVVEELISTFGTEIDGVEGLGYNGFIRLVTGKKLEPPSGRT